MPMRIKGLDRRLDEVGRIRCGARVEAKGGKTRPKALDKPRLTSSTRRLLDQAATLYGGEVVPWQDAPPGPRQWEVYLAADELPLVIPPMEALDQCYECWSGRGLLRRCDGETIVKAEKEAEVGQPCVCPQDVDERIAQAAEGNACKLTTRIRCMLTEIPSIGLWRLQTHSYYAAVGTAGMVEFLEDMAKKGRICKAVLKIEQQTRVSPKHGRRNFALPVIQPTEITPAQLFAAEMDRALLIEARPGPDETVKALPQHIADLYGDASPDERVLSVLAQIEAGIATQGGDLAQWEAWAEQTLGKPRRAFVLGDYERWLEAVRVVAKRGPKPVGEPVPHTEGPAPDPRGPDLFAKMETEAGEGT